MADGSPGLAAQPHRQRDREEPEERRELDDRVQRHRRGVFEWIANRIADHRRRMERRVLHLELGLDNLLRVVPGAAGVRHEHGLVETEERNRNQVADEEEWLDEGERERREEDGQEDIE